MSSDDHSEDACGSEPLAYELLAWLPHLEWRLTEEMRAALACRKIIAGIRSLTEANREA